MNEQISGSRPVNGNPHHELVASLQASLAQCSDGDRSRLFETREQLGDLTRRIEDGPWGLLSSLTDALQVMFGHLLRRGNLDGPAAMQIATDVIAFVDSALTLAPPEGGQAADPNDASTLATRESREAHGLKLRITPNSPAGLDRDAARWATSNAVRRTRRDGKNLPLSSTAIRRTIANPPTEDFGHVAYQMVNESRLGELLIKMGCLRTGQLDRALVLQKLSRKRLGDVLMAMEAVELESLQAALEMQRQQTLRFAHKRVTDSDGQVLGEAS
ncbi:MAG: hypothetical protein ACI8QZ_000702 [Chlamydiales bacterium]|jgi:hypothetical protein